MIEKDYFSLWINDIIVMNGSMVVKEEYLHLSLWFVKPLRGHVEETSTVDQDDAADLWSG